jgi:hypothetical protein
MRSCSRKGLARRSGMNNTWYLNSALNGGIAPVG